MNSINTQINEVAQLGELVKEALGVGFVKQCYDAETNHYTGLNARGESSTEFSVREFRPEGTGHLMVRFADTGDFSKAYRFLEAFFAQQQEAHRVLPYAPEKTVYVLAKGTPKIEQIMVEEFVELSSRMAP